MWLPGPSSAPGRACLQAPAPWEVPPCSLVPASRPPGLPLRRRRLVPCALAVARWRSPAGLSHSRRGGRAGGSGGVGLGESAHSPRLLVANHHPPPARASFSVSPAPFAPSLPVLSRSAQHAPGHPPPRPLPLVPARSPRLPPGDVHRPSAGSPCWGLCVDGLVRRRHGCSCCPCRRHRRINHLRRQPTRQKVLRCQARAPSSHTSQAALDARSVAPPLPCSRPRYPPYSCCLTCHGSLPLHPSPVG